MELKIETHNGTAVARPVAGDVVIRTVQDATDLMGNADYLGARRVLLEEHHLDPSFFDLRSGLAGEVLQKFSNYRMKLTIVGDFSKYKSKALNAFIGECNRGSAIFFVPDIKTAIAKLRK